MDQGSDERRSHAGAWTALIRFRPAHQDASEVLATLVRWENDPAIRHLFRPFKTKEDAARPTTLVDAATKLASALESERSVFFIELDGALVGEVSLMLDPPMVHASQGKTAWFGVVLGEAHARGKGFGRLAMEFIEDEARKQGAEFAQIGVFEFNARARGLYESLGYEEIARKPKFTWWKGKTWTDIRMQKTLLP